MNETEREKLLADVTGFCEEVRPAEELCYLEHRFNDQAIGLARKYNLLGIAVEKQYDGRQADVPTYAQALARIGREGSGLRTLFSAHSSIGQYPIGRFGSADVLNRRRRVRRGFHHLMLYHLNRHQHAGQRMPRLRVFDPNVRVSNIDRPVLER